MITALRKKFAGPPSPNPQGTRTKPGINVVKTDLQRRYANGVNFNMKVVIRGDRNVGKTCLFKRLQGHPFSEEYIPTDEIQVTNITWNYRCSDFIVKVDVWDVVDESRRRKPRSSGLKLDNGPANNIESNGGPQDMMVCDATFLDVYKNCNGVLLMFDITKSWTFKYVKEELERIPAHLPVLVLANKIDLAEKREVTEEEIVSFFRNFKRKQPLAGKLKAPVRLVQSSMMNANGLKYLYNFLNIPFLFVQREQLENALEANKDDINVTLLELDQFQSASNSPSHQQTPLVPKQELEEREVDSTPEFRRKKSISSASGDDNKMVDMFEEDFKSDDEDFPQAPMDFTQKIEIPEVKVEFNEELVKKEEEKLRSNLNDWLEEQERRNEQKSGEKNGLESSEEDGNPLVAQMHVDSDESEEDVIIERMKTAFKVEERHEEVAEDKEKPKSPSIPKTLDDFLNDSPESSSYATITSAEDPLEPRKHNKKKKTATKTKKSRERENDMLVEDDPDDLGLGDYEAL